jgi:hypothetical protein
MVGGIATSNNFTVLRGIPVSKFAAKIRVQGGKA